MRLIDADALIEAHYQHCNEHHGDADIFYGWSLELMQNAPTIDAVPATIDGALGYLHKVGWIQEHDRIMTEDVAPVVRCKDCKCWTD